MDNSIKNKEKERKESIQQQPDKGGSKGKKPVTPEPPQRKDPGAKPDKGTKSK